ncbi:MAG: hypothetical protein K6G25_01805 [Bacteroidales bacterium]|nr:hypothetical protein [Bacteroidales bacterium]
MDDMDLKLLKQNIKAETETCSAFKFQIPKRNWFKQYRNGISGIACLAVAALLPTLMALEMEQIAVTPYNLGVITFTVILTLYCLVKGIFTLLFQVKETEFGTSVHQYLITNAYNHLYFVYEKMVWLGGLLPLLLATLPSFIGLSGSTLYWVIASIFYVVAVLSRSRPLWRKMNQIKAEIKQLNNQQINTYNHE